MRDKENKSEFITYLIKEYSPYFKKNYLWPKESPLVRDFNDNDIKTLLILYSDEVLNTSNTADKNYLWDNLSRNFAAKIREESDPIEKALSNRESGKEGSMKSFGLLDRLSGSEEEIEEFKDGIYGINYKIIYEKLEKILERDVYPAMSDEIADV